jgi:hypothetical protein
VLSSENKNTKDHEFPNNYYGTYWSDDDCDGLGFDDFIVHPSSRRSDCEGVFFESSQDVFSSSHTAATAWLDNQRPQGSIIIPSQSMLLLEFKIDYAFLDNDQS